MRLPSKLTLPKIGFHANHCRHSGLSDGDGYNRDYPRGNLHHMAAPNLSSIFPSFLSSPRAYLGGHWKEAASRETFPVTNPADGRVVATVTNCSGSETSNAIEEADAAFPAWAALPAETRGNFLRRLARLIRERKDPLASLLTMEQGKPRAEAEAELLYGAAYLEWFAEEGRRIYGRVIPASTSGKRLLVTKEPIGVAAAITPWNFPHAMIVRKLAAALAAGCTFIVKPAPETPLSALALGQLADEAELPKGVLSIVTGAAEPIARALLASPLVRKLSFTGSTEVGKILMKSAADTVKRLTLELGGNAPFLVFPDADLERAAEDAVYAKYRNAGQTCVCVNRFLVHRNIAPKFTSLLIEKSRRLKVGAGSDPGVDIGPLISSDAVDKVARLLKDGLEKGAFLALGSMPSDKSLFVSPIVVTGVTSAMSLTTEEIFGPVSTIQEFDDDADALRLANDTTFGLAAYFHTRDLSRAIRVSEGLRYGMIGVNDSAISTVQAPFGGIKESGFGREGGSEGIEEYLNVKYISLGM